MATRTRASKDARILLEKCRCRDLAGRGIITKRVRIISDNKVDGGAEKPLIDRVMTAGRPPKVFSRIVPREATPRSARTECGPRHAHAHRHAFIPRVRGRHRL